jgi:capsular polysaccharide transport system permease protein
MDGLSVSEADGIAGRQSYPRQRFAAPPPPLRRSIRRFLPFFLVVVLPTVIGATYYYGFAADQYVSEARFVVRGPAQQTSTGLANILQTAAGTRSQDDTYAVQDYILSRDALQELVDSAGLKDIFARAEADRLSRFPGPGGGDTFEHLYKYYLKHVDVQMDSTTGVSEMTVKSFRPEDSKRIAAALLAAGERLINRMNARERENALRDARNEVTRAEARVKEVSTQLADFRNREALLDPNKQSVPMLQAITNLQAKLSSTKLEVSQLQSSSPNSPLLASARQRMTALQAQIDDARTKITGGDASLVPKIREFDLLSLDRDFADKQLASAITSLETARINADRQQLYLEPVVQPNQPDYADFPRRGTSTLVVFLTMLGIYIGGALLIAGAREHKLV